MMKLSFLVIVISVICFYSILSLSFTPSTTSSLLPSRRLVQNQAPTYRNKNSFTMKVGNDAFTRSNRVARSSQAGDRMVELIQPLGLELDEDADKNVFVKSIDPDSRAAKSGMIFVGDRIAMASATFGNDMWSCRGVGLSRVLTTIRMRNTSPVRLVLEAPDELEEKRRRAIAYAEASEEQKKIEKEKADKLLADMVQEDKELLKKRKFFGLW